MAVKNPLREEAFRLYKESKGKLTSKQISQKLNISINTINSWRSKDEWSNRIKPGAPKGNKNAIGNKGGPPKGSLNNLKHGNYCDASKFLDKGFLAKFIPASTKQIIKGIVEEGISTLDIMWDNIMLLYSSIIRSQKIMYVKNQNDLTKELKKSKIKNKTRETAKSNTTDNEEEYEYELQFAWDKQERFIKSQSSAMKNLNSMIKDYEELLHKNWDLASEEQKLRIEVLKSKINTNEDSKEDKIDKYFTALEGALKND